MERALFIGRFQPFHKGHEDAVLQIARAEDVDEVIIGIGSCRYHHWFGNPFTFEEREEFIRRSLKIDLPFQVIAIPDVHDFPKWVPHVESLCPKFDIVYCGNTVVNPLFEARGYHVEVLQRILNISATQVRDRMVSGKNWQDLVPYGTRQVLEEIDGAERIRSLHDKHSRATYRQLYFC